MHADGHYSGQLDAKDIRHRRRGKWLPPGCRPYRKAMMSLPGRQQRALDRIEQTLVTEDPGLGLRFAFFARLTRHEAMPGIEQVPRRLQRALRRAIILPLVAVSLLALLAASGLIPGRQACAAGTHPVAHTLSSLSRATRCQSGPAIKIATKPMH
jgi:Protein of unknown function (DUF3040)